MRKYRIIAIKIMAGIVAATLQASMMYLIWDGLSSNWNKKVGIIADDYNFVFPFGYLYVAAVLTMLPAFLVYTYLRARKNDADQQQRQDTAELDRFEKRITKRVDYLIKNASVDALLNHDVYKEIIDEKIGKDLLTSVDEELAKRVSQESKTIRVLARLDEVTEELKIRLEGPAGRAETQADWARYLAYFMAFIGISIALYRVSKLDNLTDQLIQIYNIADGQSVWPYIIAHSAPWIGLVVLIEFTSLLFVRLSTQASTQQRYFTESYTELKDRHAALSTIIEYGTPEQIITSARAMIVYGQRQMTESNDAETISASSNLVQSLTGLIKETVSKAGSK